MSPPTKKEQGHVSARTEQSSSSKRENTFSNHSAQRFNWTIPLLYEFALGTNEETKDSKMMLTWVTEGESYSLEQNKANPAIIYKLGVPKSPAWLAAPNVR